MTCLGLRGIRKHKLEAWREQTSIIVYRSRKLDVQSEGLVSVQPLIRSINQAQGFFYASLACLEFEAWQYRGFLRKWVG